MKVLWIIDNKLRELWGIHDIRKELKTANIELILCNKFNWNLGIDYFEPEIIILPNVRDGSKFKATVEKAVKKNIKCILYRSEGLNYVESYMEKQHPTDMLEKLTQVFLWANIEGEVAKKRGFENKLVTVGGLRFIFKKHFKKDEKIKTIGIPTTGRYTTNFLDINIPRYIYTRVQSDSTFARGGIKNEINFLFCISDIFAKYKGKFKFIIKPHPFENPQIYKDAFSNFDENIEIEEDPDIRVFLSKVDVILNQYSSANIHALKSGIPVLNLTKIIPWNDDFEFIKNQYLPTNYGIIMKDHEELDEYLNKYSPKKIYDEIVKKGDLESIEEISPTLDSIKIFTTELINSAKTTKKNKNNIFLRYINFFKYYLKELSIIFFDKRFTLYHSIKISDRRLLKKFSVLRDL